MAVITGTPNDDVLIGTPQADVINGLGGNDTIRGRAGNDQLFGQAGDDQLFGEAGDDQLVGGPGDDILRGGLGNDLLGGGPGNDQLFGDAGNDVLRGAEGNDELVGGDGNDVLYGIAGNNVLFGGAGADRVFGGTGDDRIQGGLGNDVLFGEAGNDIIRGNEGDDRIAGNAGNDQLFGGDGDDVLRGGIGSDQLFGEAGNDRLAGEAGNDVLNGGAGEDTLWGGVGNDVLNGGADNDLLLGEAGEDTLDGGAGDDVLNGGPGADTLTGGPGADTFVFGNVAHGVDQITDFTEGTDGLDLSFALPNFQAGSTLGNFVQFTPGEGGTMLAIDPSGSSNFTDLAFLQGVQIDSLSRADLGLPEPDGPPNEITVISSTADGELQDAARSGDAVQMNKSVSDDGLIVAFESEAGNLVGNDGAGSDIFVKNAGTGEIRLASADDDGVAANGISFDPAVSGNGRYVAFASNATNLVAGDTNQATDVFRKDLDTGEVVRVSTGPGGAQSNLFAPSGAFGGIAISDDGNIVAFISNAASFVGNDFNGLADVFVKNLTTGEIVRANTLANGQETNSIPTEVALSGDGSIVAFATDGSLVGADTNGVQDIYVKVLDGGALTLASATAVGAVGNGVSNTASLSDDGRFVAFESQATNLVGSDTNASRDVFVKDLSDGSILRASTTSAGGQLEPGGGGNVTLAPVISGDGNVVVFQSDAANLVVGDTNLIFDIFAKNLATDETVRVSVDNDGGQAPNGVDHASGWPAVTDDGSFVAYETQIDELVGAPTSVNQVLLAPVTFTGPQVAGAALQLGDLLDDGGSVGDGGGPAPAAGAAAFAPAIGLLVDDLLGAPLAELVG